jgi:hypothetical protein
MTGTGMARTTPQVEHDLLSGHGGAAPIAVGSPAWFAWLEQASLFAFRSGASGFTARREGRARGGGYWRAYRTVAGSQRRAYLGRATDLTIERLRAAAIQLAGDAPEPAASHESPAPPAPNLKANRLACSSQANQAGLPTAIGAAPPWPESRSCSTCGVVRAMLLPIIERMLGTFIHYKLKDDVAQIDQFLYYDGCSAAGYHSWGTFGV